MLWKLCRGNRLPVLVVLHSVFMLTWAVGCREPGAVPSSKSPPQKSGDSAREHVRRPAPPAKRPVGARPRPRAKSPELATVYLATPQRTNNYGDLAITRPKARAWHKLNAVPTWAVGTRSSVIAIDEATLSLLDARTGESRWRHTLPPSKNEWHKMCHDDFEKAIPSLYGGTVYASSRCGETLHAVRESDGRELWKRKMRGPVTGAPVVLGDRLVVVARHCGTHRHSGVRVDKCCCDARVVGLDRATGKLRWHLKLRRRTDNWPMVQGEQGLLYMLSRRIPPTAPSDTQVLAIDAARGRLKWQRRVRLVGTLSFAQGILVGRTADEGGCVALRASDGSELWRQKRVRCHESSRVVEGTRVYTLSRGLTALDLKTGKVLWRRKLPTSGYDYSQLIGVEGALVAGGGQGHLAAFNLPEGTLRWRYRVKLRWYHQLRGLFPFSFGYVGVYRHAGLTGVQ